MLKFKEGISRAAWLLFAAWCVFVAGIWLQAQQTIRTISALDELSSKVIEVRNVFNFERSYRAQYVDDASHTLQLAYELRLQLQSEYSDRWNGPDLTQLLYATDRFLESAKAFISSDSELVTLADELHNSRESASHSEQLRTMYYRLSALVLEAMFSDVATSTETYQQLDSLFTESQAIESKEQVLFQRWLAQTSNVLAAHAQGSHISDQLLNLEFPSQLASVIRSLERKLIFYITLLTLISGALLAIFSWAVFDKAAPLAADKNVDQAMGVEPCLPSKEHDNPLSTEITTQNVNTINDASGVNEPYIDIEKMLDSLSNDEDSVRMLLEVFIKDHIKDAKKLRTLMSEEKGKEQAQRVAHSLKGVSGSIGAMPLHSISGDIEFLIKQGNQVPDDKLEQLENTLEKTTLFAEKVLNSRSVREVLTD